MLEHLTNGGIPGQKMIKDASVEGSLVILPAGLAVQEKHVNLIKERIEEVVKANRCIEKVIDLGMKLPGLNSLPRLQSALERGAESQEQSATVLSEAKFAAKFKKVFGSREQLTAEGATTIAAKLKETLNELSAHGMLAKHEMNNIGN